MTSSQSNSQEFIKRIEEFGVANGLSRSVARVLGYLIVCEPARQSAHDMQVGLGLSAGTISSAVNMLRHAGLIQRVQYDHDRPYYYELDSEGWKRATLQRLHSLRGWADLATLGLQSQPDNTRLTEMRDIYETFDRELTEIMKRYT